MSLWSRLSALWRPAAPPKAKRPLPGANRRGYAMAEGGRLNDSWRVSPLSANAELRTVLPILRYRSREAELNNDYATRFLRMCRRNIVGHTGVRLQMRVANDDGSSDEVANRAIEAGWRDWGRRGVCDMTGLLSWRDVQRQALETVARDGECLVRLIDGPVNRYAFALQVLEVDYLHFDRNQELPNGNRIFMGVEVDPWGRPQAYHVSVRHPGDYGYLVGGNWYERIPAADILHLYVPERPGQARGVPWMRTAASRMKKLDAYEEAEVIAARVAAAKMGFFTSKTGDEYSGESTGEEGDENACITEAEPGTFEELPEGMSFTPWTPDHPAGNFMPFTKRVLQGISSGLDVAYCNLANDLEAVSFSSIRQGTLEEREMWKELQDWFVESLPAPVFARWLRRALDFGVLGSLPAAKYDKFHAPTWRAKRWSWVDPKNDAESKTTELGHALTSRRKILSESSDDDFEDVVADLEYEERILAEKKIPVARLNPKPAAAPPAEPPPAA